jgi:hypothetical protein
MKQAQEKTAIHDVPTALVSLLNHPMHVSVNMPFVYCTAAL